jgi:predicted phosphoribosyltransferase
MHPGINDITAFVQRDVDAGSTGGLSFAERQGHHHLSGPLPRMRRLLVIDDFIATGESAAHVIALMRPHVHEMPEVVIVAPLWVPSKNPKQRFLW